MDTLPKKITDIQDNSIADITINAMPSVFDQSVEQPWKLPDVLEEISTSETLANLVLKVRNASTDKVRKARKKAIPLFCPCVYKDMPTGIVQLDYDVYNIEESTDLKKILIEKIPSLLYAFISPSGGLKYGIWTDYTNNPKNFSTAYFHTKELLSGAGVIKKTDKDKDEYDNRMQRITCPCFFSYDPDTYFNPSPKRLYITEDVKKKVIQEQKDSPTKKNLSVPPANITTTDADKIIFLEGINAIAGNIINDFLHRSDRKKLSRAIVNEFGYSDGADLVLNTLQFFNGDSEYLDSLLKHKTEAGGGTILLYARKCGYKGITETFKKNNTAGDTERAVLVPKDITRPKRYSAQEATALIESRVDQFLKDRINIQLIVEMGVGKTQITLNKLIEYMDSLEQNDAEPLRIAIFVPSHKLGSQSLSKLLNFEEEQIVADFGDDEVFSLRSKRLHKVIGGYSVHCEKLKNIPEKDRKGMVRNAYECDNCEYKEIHCWYVSQFFHSDDLVRIYPQNYLYKPSNYERDYKPDLIVVDEDISAHSIVDREYESRDGNIWKRVIQEGIDTLEPSDINQAKSSLKIKIEAVKKRLKDDNDGSTVQTLTSLYAELEDLNLMLSGEGVISTYDGKAHVCHKNSIHKKWTDVPMLYLNGTGNEKISDAIFGEGKFDITEEIRVEYNPNVTVYQLQNKSFNREQVEKAKQELFDLISYFYCYDKSCFVSYSSFIDECLKNNPDYNPNRFMHYGYTQGQSDFEDKSILVVIGRHYLPHQALAMKGRVLFGCNDIDTDRAVCTRTIEMNDTDYDAEIGCRDFTDERMQLLGRYYNEGETLQAIHRLRLLHKKEQKTVIYLSNHVLEGLQVDKFLIATDVLLSENRMKLVKAVQENGAIKNKPADISKASFGLTSKDVSNLKATEWYQKNNPFFFVEEGDDGFGRLVDRYGSGKHNEMVLE